jgi:hypothetical protein
MDRNWRWPPRLAVTLDDVSWAREQHHQVIGHVTIGEQHIGSGYVASLPYVRRTPSWAASRTGERPGNEISRSSLPSGDAEEASSSALVTSALIRISSLNGRRHSWPLDS